MTRSRLPSVDLNEIATFVEVARTGSFTAASINLGVPKSTVSRRVTDLEDRIGARLLQRTTRKLSLTDVGRVYYEHCARIVGEVEEAQNSVMQFQSAPRGLVRVTVPVTSYSLVGPVVAEFLTLYPEVEVEILSSDRHVDLVEERFDLALRAGKIPDTAFIARRIAHVRRHLFAAPEFLDRVGRPQSPKDLERLDCVVFAPEGNIWRLVAGNKSADVQVQPRLLVNDHAMLRSVVRSGFGIALLSERSCAEDVEAGLLCRVLDAWSARDVPISVVYPSKRQLSPKVGALLDLLRDRLGYLDKQPAASGGARAAE